ncbi:MAG TPA: hypothetical protein V6D10_17895 [Trichocoleus sp.]
MSKSDVLRYVLKRYQDGEITRQEFESWMEYHSTAQVRAKIETTAKRLINRSPNCHVQSFVSR